jgi:hypothetical protein
MEIHSGGNEFTMVWFTLDYSVVISVFSLLCSAVLVIYIFIGVTEVQVLISIVKNIKLL